MNPQMGAAPQGIPTFACPSCGYGVPNTMPAGIQFPCPGCQQVVTSPGGGWNAGQAAQYQAWALEHGNTAAALADAQAPQAEGRQNFSSTSNQITIVDPDGRRLIIGYHVDQSRQWAVRAQDARTGALAWESERTLHLSSCPDRGHMGVRAGLLLVAIGAQLLAFDSRSGRRVWTTNLGANPETRGDVDLPDEMDIRAVASVLVVRTTEENIVGVDAASGRVLWQHASDARLRHVGDLAVFLGYSDGIEVLEPTTGRVIASLRGDFDEATTWGQLIALEMEHDDQDGFALVDPTTGQVQRFVPAGGIDFGWGGDCAGTVGRYLVAQATDKGVGYLHVIDPEAPLPKPGFFASLLGSKKPSHVGRKLPGPNVVVRKLRTTNDAICAEVAVLDGPTHVWIIDPTSLSVRHDSGPLAFGETSPHLAARGPFAAYVVPTDQDKHAFELRVVLTQTGQPTFTRAIGRYNALYFDDQGVVVHYDTNILVLNPSDGAVLASYPV